MSEVLGLASSIISLESLGTKISKRLTSLPNDLFPTEDISNLVSDLWTTNQYLHELPEALQYFRSGSFITSISNDLRDILELLNDLSDTRKDRQKRSLASHGSQQDIASVRLRLIVVNRDLARIIDYQNMRKFQKVAARVNEIEEQVNQKLIATYMPGISKRQKQFLEKIAFSSGKNHYIQLPMPLAKTPDIADDLIQTQDSDCATSESLLCQEINDQDVESLLSLAGNKDQLRLFVCGISLSSGPENEGLLLQQMSYHIPFQKQTFLSIVRTLGIPPLFFQMLFTGTAAAMRYHQDDQGALIAYIFRTPSSSTENWTLAMSWDPGQRTCMGVIHGLQANEMSDLRSALSDAKDKCCHPLLVPSLLCQMLVDSDANNIRKHASDLYQVEFKTNYHGFSTPKAVAGRTTETPEIEFEDITRSLNFINSRLAFHEMRINANLTITKNLIQNCSDLVLEAKDDEFKTTRLAPVSTWLEKSLQGLRIECQALLLEVACNQKIAQSQLDIVYNLVAQRDNKDNLKMAKISTDIAAVTKNDSFAMRTIAVMSIAFLPGTFVASFFSMSMFNWQASGTEPVLSSRFWIYWAVTIPLTLLVLLVWLSWLHQHKSHERTLQSVPNLQTRPKANHDSIFRNRFQPPRLRSQTKGEDDEADTEADGQRVLPRAKAGTTKFAQPVRADTLTQGPRR